jgi:serine/threonine-protein kinase
LSGTIRSGIVRFVGRLPLGTAILGRYVLIGAIGQGGVSTVYAAVDTRRGRKLAVKILAPTLAGNPAARDDVRREALITDRLRHPSVPRVFEYGDAPLPDGSTVPYVVFELLTGIPLRERLASGALPWPEAVRIAATVADVLAVAHRRGVVHRDLAARNIMLTPAGVKIIDFGMATAALRTGEPAPRPTVLRTHPGRASSYPGRAPFPADHAASRPGSTPLHADRVSFHPDRASFHPDRAFSHADRGPSHADPPPSHPKTAFARPADDVYTLGVLLYEMLTGKSPYPPGIAATIRAAGRVANLAPTPVLIVPGLPATLRDLVRACMAKNPDDRPESAQVALSLWQILDHPGVREPAPA